MGSASHENGSRSAHPFSIVGSVIGLGTQAGQPHCPDLAPVNKLVVGWLNDHPGSNVNCTLEHRIVFHPRSEGDGGKAACAETAWVLSGDVATTGPDAYRLLHDLASCLLVGLKQAQWCRLTYPGERGPQAIMLPSQ
ncbi:MAG: hypothetical protein C5B53_02395 [Candidatus Melainabacteria bacterium]|nr:MAG: hypothetical protein C5B53_02395 [Candidatus Melainabacteria bacterium]